MAVTKRTRFEVLRRDESTCRYCGQSAPDVKLTVDHVVPVALGGTDEPSNLAAACWDCNVGKASTSPTEPMVAQVSEATLQYIRLARSAWRVREAAIDAQNQYIDQVGEAISFSKPPEWRSSVGRWYVLDVPLTVVLDGVRIAADKYDPWGNTDRFKYLCGVIWNQVRETNAAIESKVEISGEFMTDDDVNDLVDYGRYLEQRIPTIDRLLLNVLDGSFRDARRDHDEMPSLEDQLCG